MSAIDNLRKRIKLDSDNFVTHAASPYGLNSLETRLAARGGSDQWVRMRQDKLRSLNRALLYSYQSAIVQRYDVKKNSQANNIIQLITRLQDILELNDNEKIFLSSIEEKYQIQEERGSQQYIIKLEQIVNSLVDSTPKFRCLINHDKLKVDYEDKIISIPFREEPVGSDEILDTQFHNGTVFKWVHGNKEEWTPDTYWIVYMQYSEETAYFRAEIRKADEEIQIVTIDAEGNQSTVTYRGWMTGPNETTALWNVKKDVAWNDMNYTKLLYITKDQDTLAFFQRFDRIIINGKPWEVQAYNENYSTNKSGEVDSGIIRVALRETYTGSSQFIKQHLEAVDAAKEKQNQYDAEHTNPRIDGPTKVKPYSILTFVAKDFVEQGVWSISNTKLAKIKTISQDGKTVTVQILTGFSNYQGFYINYGNNEETKIHIIIESL